MILSKLFLVSVTKKLDQLKHPAIGAGIRLQDEIRSHEAAGLPHGFNLVTSWDEVADG